MNNTNTGINTTLQGAQLIVLIIGIVAAVLTIGRRDAQIERNIQDITDLRGISEDLLKATISVQMSLQFHDEQLAALYERIERLEG
tara:strand:- start:750 stop:1007 length:258 start_codon:yes stop_codon:yes gene_type:complete